MKTETFRTTHGSQTYRVEMTEGGRVVAVFRKTKHGEAAVDINSPTGGAASREARRMRGRGEMG